MWQEDEEEDVRSYWMTLRAGEDTLIWKRRLWIAICGGIVLKEALDLSSDRLLNNNNNNSNHDSTGYEAQIWRRWVSSRIALHRARDDLRNWLGGKGCTGKSRHECEGTVKMGRKGSEGERGHICTRVHLNSVNYTVFFKSFGNLLLLRCGSNISFSCHTGCSSVAPFVWLWCGWCLFGWININFVVTRKPSVLLRNVLQTFSIQRWRAESSSFLSLIRGTWQS